MKSILFSFLISLLIQNGCTYTITRSYDLPTNKTVDPDLKPMIVFKKNLYGLNCIYKGSLKLEYGGAPGDIPKEKAFDELRNEARCLDANLINITNYVKMVESDVCYSCIADIYSVQYDAFSAIVLTSEHRDTLKYNTRSKLEWKDFKVFITEESIVPYRITENIIMNFDENLWGTYKEFSSQAVLFLDASGVKKSFINDSNLLHIQMIFDLAQIYSKRLDGYVNNEMKKTSDPRKVRLVHDEYFERLIQEIRKYSIETEYGKNFEMQNRWAETIRVYKRELNIK